MEGVGEEYIYPFICFPWISINIISYQIGYGGSLYAHVDSGIYEQNPLVLKTCLCEAILVHPPSGVAQCSLARKKLQM